MSENLVRGQTDSIPVPEMFAKRASIFNPKRRSDSTNTLSRTLPVPRTTQWTRWEKLAGRASPNWPNQLSHFCSCWFCWARKTEEAEPPPSCTPLTVSMRLHSAHISQWDVNVAGKWDSALKGNSALRAHVARAAGIELAHREDQYVIDFLWDMWKIYDRIKAHLFIPQLVARGYPIEILASGTLTHISPRCLQVGRGFSDVITGCASSILAGCLQSYSWTRGLLFELVQSLGYVIPGSVCEGTLMICHSFRRARAAFNFCTVQPMSAKRRETAQPSWA